METLDGVRGAAAALGIQEFATDNADVPVDADYAYSIVSHGANRSGGVATVEVIVHGVAGVIDGIDSVDVIDVTIAVVIDSVDRHVVPVVVLAGLAGVDPNVVRQVFVVIVEPGVDNTDDDRGRAGGLGPGTVCVNVRA